MILRLFTCCLWPKAATDDDDNGNCRTEEGRRKRGTKEEEKRSKGVKWLQRRRKSLRTTPTDPVTVTSCPELSEANQRKIEAHGSRKQWKCVRVLGKGGYGQVKLMKNKKTKDLLAVKKVECRRNGLHTNEPNIHSQLSHDNILRLFHWQETGQKLRIYLEFVSGGSLVDHILTLTTVETLNYFEQLMQGVNYLHSRGVVHRDLKPGNLLLTETKVLKISDFGLSCVYIQNGREVCLMGRVGSRPFMAPEVFRELTYRGPAVDLWACGVILFLMTTTKCPWAKATCDNKNYNLWVTGNKALNKQPHWKNMEDSPLGSQVKCLLDPDSKKRYRGWTLQWAQTQTNY
ncbi:serine/threonine-protein kinase Chk1-like [Oratosquilla oratoria]|uniref:serine/threonine-protein kinase Chk1-like n=1 Tax=Oratosquilla oratoria TaxID=337810 RepID=UPI003F771849